MKSSRIIILSLVVLLAVSSFAATTKPVSHGKSLKGTIVSVNEKARSFSLKDGAGKTHSLIWNTATKVTGPALKAGEDATVRYMWRNKQNVATSIVTVAPKTAEAKKG